MENKMKNFHRLTFLLLISITICLISCSKHEPERIAISKGIGSEGYLQYENWIKELNPKAELINLYGLGLDSALILLKSCNGLILSGGPDVHPYYYGKMEDFDLCEIDSVRDTLEFKLIEAAFSAKMPILAVCRGMQIINVYLGGTLISDIPTYVKNNIGHRCEDKDKCFHNLNMNKSRNFQFWETIKNTKVNTNHHQAVDYLAEDFYPTALAEDGIIEAYEWINPNNKSYLIAVQWHPERLSDENQELSDSLGINFLREVSNFRKSKSK